MLSNAKLLESACCKWQMYGGVVVTEPGRAGAGERVLMRVRSSAESVWGCFRSRRKEKLGQSLHYRLIISAPSRLLHLPSSSTEKSGSRMGIVASMRVTMAISFQRGCICCISPHLRPDGWQ